MSSSTVSAPRRGQTPCGTLEGSDPTRLSVIIPVYNEESVIQSTVESVVAYLGRAAISSDIIVVDDGSTDRTTAVVERLSRAIPGLRLLRAEHRGKGAAVKRGVLAASGSDVLFMDADHSTRIEELEKCLPWLRDGYDVVIGSRKMPGARVTVRQPLLREAMGKGFTWLTNVMLRARVSDITCGFKCFQAEAARQIFSLQRIQGWGFDAEILFLARWLGYRIKEIPVVWADDGTTKVRLLSDSLRSFRELLDIRIGAWRGRYPRHFASRNVSSRSDV